MDRTFLTKRQTRHIKALGIGWILLSLLWVTGCGGGGGGGGPVNPSGTATLEGVAAGGAPLVGTVTVRDASGETSAETVNQNGTFTLDVTGMTPPFVVWAEGTVNGAPATYYSTRDSDGRINVTPLTHLIMALALGSDPVAYYAANPSAGPPSPADIAAAAQIVGQLFADTYVDLNIPAGFDLMEGEFNADGTGFDQLLEMITVSVDGNACSIVEKESGQELLADDDMGDAAAPQAVPSDQAQAMTSGMAAAREYFSLVTSAYEDGGVNATERDALSPWLATGIIDRGRNREQILAALAAGGSLPAGINFEAITFHRLMYGATDHPLGPMNGLSEKGTHDIGFWCTLRSINRDGIFSSIHAFVLEDGQWKNFGNRLPFDDSLTVLPLASHFVYNNGDIVQTGLAFSIPDRGLRGQALGVESVVIANDALPDIVNPFGSGTIPAVIMKADNINIPGSQFRVVAPSNLAGRNVYLTTDDPDLLGNLAHNPEFLNVALDASNQPIHAWTSLLFEQPHPIPHLYKNLESYFPKMVGVGNAAVRPVIPLDQLAGGPLLAWNNLADPATHPTTASVDWWNGNTQIRTETFWNPAYGNNNLDLRDWTSQAFLPPPGEWSQVNGRMTVSMLNQNAHVFSKGISFSVGEPTPITYAASLPFVSHRTQADGSHVYYGFVGLTDNGQPVDPARISNVSINPDEGTPTAIDALTIDRQHYYQIDCTSTTGCVIPDSDAPNGTFTGVNFTLHAGASFGSAMYTIRANVDGTPFTKACPIMAPGTLSIPVITGLQAQWEASGELNLSWQPPAVTTNIHQMTMWFSSAKPQGGYRVVLRVNLSGAALSLSQLTIPANLVANIRILKDAGRVAWNIDTRSYYPIGSEYFEIAGSRSETVTITGW